MMQSALTRRPERGPRIPLDGLVELSHERFDESFEADGLNVGVGGLSMRATYLPDVGSRLSCRFPFPRLGVVEADAEVVWSHDKGPHTGEFGLRFLGLDPVAERAIRDLVRGGVASPSVVETPQEDLGTEDAVVEIDGVRSAIKAAVVARDEELLSLAQELPFLRLKTGVTVVQDGRRGRIESVDLVMVDEVPRLLIDIVFDPAVAPGPDGDTLPDFVPVPKPANDTAVDLPAPAVAAAHPSGPRIVAASPKAQAVIVGSAAAVQSRPTGEVVAAPPLAASDLEAPLRPPVLFERLEGAAPTIRGLLLARFALLAATVRRWAQPKLVALSSHARALLRRLAALGASARARGWPLVRAGTTRVSARLAAVGRVVAGPVLARLGIAGAKAKRRTTAAPPLPSNVIARRTRAKEARPEGPRPNRRRAALAVGLVVAGGAVLAYALGAEDPPASAALALPAPVPVPTPVPTPATALEPFAVDAEPSSLALADEVLEGPAAEGPSPISAGATTSRGSGLVPPPSFPSLRDGARPGAPTALPAGSPYGVDVREGGFPDGAPAAGGGVAFGAPSVPNGQSFVLRMSQPVREIRGAVHADGFTVTMPDSLSLDRAGPIAASHPLVERAMILNRGDRSELTIVFAEGRSPAYRVTARGAAIEVVIARR